MSVKRASWVLIVWANVVAVFAGGCGSAPSVTPNPTAPSSRLSASSDRELSALLLLIADRRLHEPYTTSRALEGGPARRTELAVALGRSLDPRARMVLEELTLDPDEEVAAEAAFGLGLLGDERAQHSLRRCVTSCTDAAAIEAVRALARLGVGLETIVDALDALDEQKRRHRLLPALAAFRGPLAVAAASVGAADDDAGLRVDSAAALSLTPSAEAAVVARRLLGDADPETRRFAAVVLGHGGSRADVPRLLLVLDDPEPRVVAAAIAAAAELIRAGQAAPEDQWRLRMAGFLADPRSAVRLTALATADAFLRDPVLANALGERAEAGPAWERHLAVRALARGGEDRAVALMMKDRGATDPITRASAAEIAAVLGVDGVVDALRADSHPRVRASAWLATLERWSEPTAAAGGTAERDRLLRQVLSDPDLGVREMALDWLQQTPIAPLEILNPVLEAARGGPALPLRLAAVRAIASRGAAERLERGGAVLALEKVFGDSDHPTRREVATALGLFGQEPPAALGAREVSWGPERYREILDLGGVAPSGMRVSTSRGEFLIELECAQAPLSCHFVRQLAGQGYYENTLVAGNDPGGVVVLGDSRGDGRGGAGFRVADEPVRSAVSRGAVGLAAAAGPDTAAGVLFITLSPRPELTGQRALIGRVASGMEVVESLVPGDRIERVELIRTKY